MKNTLTQEGEIGPAIPHPFNEFELVHLAFHLPVGIDQEWRIDQVFNHDMASNHWKLLLERRDFCKQKLARD